MLWRHFKTKEHWLSLSRVGFLPKANNCFRALFRPVLRCQSETVSKDLWSSSSCKTLCRVCCNVVTRLKCCEKDWGTACMPLHMPVHLDAMLILPCNFRVCIVRTCFVLFCFSNWRATSTTKFHAKAWSVRWPLFMWQIDTDWFLSSSRQYSRYIAILFPLA